MSWLSRAGAWLLPPALRDWAEALWAEAGQVPAGWQRLAWQAGAVRLVAREIRLASRIAILLVFAVVAWAAWPSSTVPMSHGAAVQGYVVVTIALLACLPLAAGRLLGPPASRTARWLRAGFCAAILAFIPAKATTEMLAGTVPRGGINLHTFDFITQSTSAPGTVSGGPNWGGEIALLVITAGYLSGVIALTARRARVASGTLVIGAGAGLVLGVVMYAVDPFGGDKVATNPWLRGSDSDPLVALAWIVLFLAPAIAGALAGRRYSGPDPGAAPSGRARQSLAAGMLSVGVGALTVTVLGTGTTALMIKSALARGWLYHGQHLTASAVYGRELYASWDVQFYGLVCVGFLIVGLLMSALGASIAASADPGSSGGPPGPPGPEQTPPPPDGAQLAEAGADQGPLRAV